jgi:flagellar motor switch protein FliN/FliY
MSAHQPDHALGHEFHEELRPAPAPVEHLNLNMLARVPVTISADIGSCRLLVREILDLKRGSILPLDKLAGEMADVFINSVPFAKGEVVVIGDMLHIRIAEVMGATESLDGANHG